MYDQTTMERKALEKLVSAILGKEDDKTRLDAIEDAMAISMVALEGDDNFMESEYEDLRDGLFALALQVTTARIDEEDVPVITGSYHRSEEDEDLAYFMVTRDPILIAMMNHSIQQVTAHKGKNDIN